MARIHGRFGRLYLGADSSAAASPVAGTTRWTINSQTPFVDATAQGDTSTVSLAGLPGGDFTFESIYDDSAYTGNIFTSAAAGTAVKAYFYPSTSDATAYIFGTVFVSASLESPVDGVTRLSGTGAAATSLISVGIS
jgi:hypothetical protein